MPLQLTYLLKNLTRNPLRSLLTCGAVALPTMIFVLSVAVIDGIERFLDNSAQQIRLAVTSKTSIVNPLPLGYRRKMESLDPQRSGLRSVCSIVWIGGTIENDPRLLSTLAVDHDTFFDTFPDTRLAPDELEQWRRDRQAIALGRATARQFGWKKGDRVTIIPSVPPYQPMRFHVISTLEQGADPVTNWCRLDYLLESLERYKFRGESASFFFVKCATQRDLEHYREQIDQLFATSSDPTRTVDEKTFMNEFISQQFDLPRNLSIFSTVTVLVAVLAAANTMSMNFRDRLTEYATLKSLGFGGWTIFSLIQSESLLLCGLGGVLGAGLPLAAFTLTPLKNVTLPLIQQLEIEPQVVALALLISLGIGLLAALWPSALALRLKVVSALRNLE